MPALGDRFRAAREARGLSLSDVAEQIRIRSVYLGAIEEENWKTIGAPVYIRGFLRTYARFLGLDPEEIVAVFNGEIPPAPGMAAQPHVESKPVARSLDEPKSGRGFLGPLIWVAGIVAVALVAFVIYNEVTMRHGPVVSYKAATSPPIAYQTPAEPDNASPSPDVSPSGVMLAIDGTPCPSPLPSTSAASAVSPSSHALAAASPTPCPSPSPIALSALGPNSMAVVLSATSWLRVTVDGSVSMEGTFPAGTAKAFRGKTALVRVGNAGGVQIFVDGKDVGKLGKAGDVVDRSFAL